MCQTARKGFSLVSQRVQERMIFAECFNFRGGVMVRIDFCFIQQKMMLSVGRIGVNLLVKFGRSIAKEVDLDSKNCFFWEKSL